MILLAKSDSCAGAGWRISLAELDVRDLAAIEAPTVRIAARRETRPSRCLLPTANLSE